MNNFEAHLISVLLEGSGGIKKLTRKTAALQKKGKADAAEKTALRGLNRLEYGLFRHNRDVNKPGSRHVKHNQGVHGAELEIDQGALRQQSGQASTPTTLKSAKRAATRAVGTGVRAEQIPNKYAAAQAYRQSNPKMNKAITSLANAYRNRRNQEQELQGRRN